MCGIAGFYGNPAQDAEARALLRRMVRLLAHRGPDADGVHVEVGAGLAHARLSIIDLAAGAQPMASTDGALWLTFNGEIFNYIELRRDLIARGHRFRTESDTEVILHLYQEMGTDCVAALNGDFAFALWDARRNQMMLARDRMGVRPLFYTHRSGTLWFASEVKALLGVPGIAAVPDPLALEQIFTLWHPLAPRTPFKGIWELPPAHVLIARPGSFITRPYWDLRFPDAEEADADDRPAEAVQEELRALLFDATDIRLRADVPVGAYLSGGLDSSIITAVTQKIAPSRLHTFSVTFETDEFDESAFQQEMVRALGTHHEAVQCTGAMIGEMFPEVIRHIEGPIVRTAPAPLFALSKLVRDRGYKVVLTGEGADEVFAGYDIFKEAKLRRFCAAQPHSPRRRSLLRRLYPYLPALGGQSQRYLEAFFATGAGDVDDPLFSHLPRVRTTAGAKALFSAGLREQIGSYDVLAELRESLPADFGRWHPLSKAQYLETRHLLPGYILSSQGDRVAMAHAVEGRFPFLDHRLVEFAARIPPKLKLKALREKHVLRAAMADLLPQTVGSRPKQPYRAPDAHCFFGSDGPRPAASCLAASQIREAGYFEPRAVERLMAKCSRQQSIGFRDNTAMVGVVATQIWHHEYVAAAGTSVASRPAA